jgi:fucose permease
VSEVAGAAITEKIVARTSAHAVLAASACASAASLALLVAARSPLEALGALVALGGSAAPHYPLLKAAAYDSVPGRPGLVNAAAQAFVVVDVVLPLAVGAAAARHGLGAALGALAIQPVTVLFVALAMAMKNGSRAPSRAPSGHPEAQGALRPANGLVDCRGAGP